MRSIKIFRNNEYDNFDTALSIAPQLPNVHAQKLRSENKNQIDDCRLYSKKDYSKADRNILQSVSENVINIRECD